MDPPPYKLFYSKTNLASPFYLHAPSHFPSLNPSSFSTLLSKSSAIPNLSTPPHTLKIPRSSTSHSPPPPSADPHLPHLSLNLDSPTHLR
ncbi:hypothetical protein Pcinc_044010 [Petrolisthes cinctipes]|uniref:Uncharacterized protein n=1 Tax=Petrolisthes cinctipes TaxID=88211 RepID=A0AAE1EHB0_PETCI|nr:hypothetical protein Pcinc_044010 [Petrolisthes cinctipes]